MRDINRGHSQLFVQVTQFDLHLIAQLLVERGQRFIHQQDSGFKDNGAGDGNALTLSTG